MKRLLLTGLLVGCSLIMLNSCGQDGSKTAAKEGTEASASAESDAASALSEESTRSETEKERAASVVNGEITKENLAAVSEALKAAGLSRVDLFEDWVTAYANGIPEDTETSGFADPDCRMTVMLLAGESIRYKEVEKEYKGTYLMFDMDAIENQEEYRVLKEQASLFATLFGEHPISKRGFSETFPDTWKRCGISFDNDKASIISIVFQTMEGTEAYVGHTGILVPYGDGYLFVEKLAFSEPYQVTKVGDAGELIDIFSARPDYQTEAEEPAPLVYENAALIGELNK